MTHRTITLSPAAQRLLSKILEEHMIYLEEHELDAGMEIEAWVLPELRLTTTLHAVITLTA